MIELTDTHCHIHSIGQTEAERITAELWSKAGTSTAKVIKEANNNHVSRLITVGCSLSDSQLAVATAKQFAQVWASIGIHPHEAKDHIKKQTQSKFRDLVNREKVVAIGECGLDYYYNHSVKKDQFSVLEFQLQLAKESNLPVIFHVREAFSDFWPILNNFKGTRGVLHSFTDNKLNLDKALSEGLFIGVNGIATFTKNQQQLDIYKNIPLTNLLLETDSPFLTPSPIRGSINEPKNINFVAEFLANLRGVPKETIASKTTDNATLLFSL